MLITLYDPHAVEIYSKLTFDSRCQSEICHARSYKQLTQLNNFAFGKKLFRLHSWKKTSREISKHVRDKKNRLKMSIVLNRSSSKGNDNILSLWMKFLVFDFCDFSHINEHEWRRLLLLCFCLLQNGNLISLKHVVDTKDDFLWMFTFVPILPSRLEDMTTMIFKMFSRFSS